MKQSAPWLKKALIILFWLLVWQTVSLAVDNDILLVGPMEMMKALLTKIRLADFWKTIALSFFKISSGFLLAFAAGISAGWAACRFPLVHELLEPVMTLVKSVPVAAFVILALIWIGSGNLSVFISFLVVFPIIYVNTLEGIKSADEKLLEMAWVFSMSGFKKLFYIYRPALFPYLHSGLKISLGMSWKSGIAAEVIGVPGYSIGEKLYMAKIYLNTADLFAWTFVIILISALSEKLFLWLLGLCGAGRCEPRKSQ